MRTGTGLVLGLLVLTGCGGADVLHGGAPASPPAETGTGLAARLCAEVAEQYDGEVAAAHDTTVQAVRDHLGDPHDTGGNPSVGPVPGAYAYPAGWAEMAPDDPAAACYIDADIPVSLPPGAPAADRALVMAAEGATSFLVSAGPKESMGTAPLAP